MWSHSPRVRAFVCGAVLVGWQCCHAGTYPISSYDRLQGAIVREVLGPYDFVVELEADTPEDLTAVLRNQIRPLPGVVSTTTCTWY